MKENTVKQILKKSVALAMALLIAFSATWTGLATVSFATDGGEAEPEAVDVGTLLASADDNDIISGTTIKVNVKGTTVTYLKFTPTYTGNYHFYSSTNMDTVGSLYDAEKNQLAYNDDGGEGNNFSITFRLVAGTTYYWGARYHSSDSTGSFDVTLLCLSCNHNNKTSLEAKAPTCTDYGYSATEFCNDCNGFVSHDAIIPPTHVEANGKTVAAVEATCTSYGYSEGVWCDECNAWISGHEKTVLSHTDENNDNSCDACVKTMPLYSGRYTENYGDVSFNLYDDGTLEFFGEGALNTSKFSYSKGLVGNIVINEGITEIYGSAFSYCSNLTSVTFPSSLTYIYSDAFSSCNNLKKVYAPDVKSWVNIEFYSYSSNPMDYASELYLGNKLATDIVIPEGVTKISDRTFYNCKDITSVIIPEGVTTIGKLAFYNCESLTSIILPEGVTTIGDDAFYNCESLTSITIPQGVTTIGDDVFSYCESLKSITLPSTLAYIGGNAFDNCEKLEKVYASDVKSWLNIEFYNYLSSPMYYATELYFDNKLATDVVIPEGVTKLNRYAFYFCQSITSVTIPVGVTTIDYAAFYNCKNLKSVKLPEGLTSIGESAFENCYSLTDIIIPKGVTGIGASAFDSCKSLESVTIPEGVTSIGEYTFDECYSLKSVTLPEGVTSIGNYAFDECYSLKSVALPDSVKTIGYYAFSECDFTCITLPEGLTSIGNSAFDSNVVIYCKTGSYAASWAESNGNPFVLTDGTDAESISTGKCGTGVSYTFDKRTGILEIKGSGEMASFSQTKTPWYDNRYYVREIIIPETVTAIGSYAFENCYNLESITIPDSITTVGKYAFYDCYNLQSVTMGKGITFIGDSAFYDCENLEKVYAPDIESWLKIDFYEYDSTPMYYASELYFGGKLATEIVIPEGTTRIYDYAFSRCDSLTGVVIPGSVKYIGEYSFGSCKNLKNVTLSNGLLEIDDSFGYCTSLESISIPYSVKKIYSSSFSGCTSLTDILVFNPECEFATECGFNLNQTIYGVPGSTAEAFAKQIGADFYDIATVHTHQFVAQEVRGYCSYKLCSCGTPEYVVHTDTNYDAICDNCSKSVNDIEIGETITLYLENGENIYIGFTATKEGEYIISTEGDYSSLTKDVYYEDKNSGPPCDYIDGTLICRLTAGKKVYWRLRPYYDSNDQTTEIKVTLTYRQSHTCSYTGVITEQPTCTEPGIRTYSCTCGASYTSIVPANGHTFGAWYISKQGSCKDGTVLKRDCSKCTVKDTISLGATGDHKAETIVSRATDTHDGKIIKSCSVCGEKISTTAVAKIASVTLSATKYTYNGKAKTPTVTVKDSKGKTLKKDTDYTVTYSSSSRKSIGKYTVTVKFKGNYGGTDKLSFTIVPDTATGVKASAASTSSVKLTWKAVSGATNYRVYKYDSSKKKYVSVAFVSGTSYTVSSLKAATTYKFKVRAYTELSDDSFLCSALSSEVSATTKLAAPSISKITSSSKGSVTVKWSNVSGESGYQLYYATSKNGTYKSAASLKADKTTGSKSKLTSKKTYYFKVRAYKTVGKTTIYSAWSSVKSVKVK